MSLLTIIQKASLELGFNTITTVVNSSDLQTRQLLAQANRAVFGLRRLYQWPQLSKEYTFSTVASTAAYALPDDFDKFINCTQWDRTNHWEMLGPLTAQDWQFRKSGITTSAPRIHWRFKGLSSTQFYLDPTPDSALDLVFEYQSKNCVRPQTWAQGTIFAANSYCFYNGNYYSTTAGGTAGATPPTHTSSSASDGTVTWTYFDDAYETFLADTDVSNIDENLVVLETKWRYLQSKSLEGWELMKAEAEDAASSLSANNRGATKLSLNMGRWARSLVYPHTPETGFGS